MSISGARSIFERFMRLVVICAVSALCCAAMAQSSTSDPVLAKSYFEQGKAAHDGVGQPQNFELARENYLRASDLGNSDALINLGYMYSMGEGVERDYVMARKYYERAADLGESVARKNLRMMDAAGLGKTEIVTPQPQIISETKKAEAPKQAPVPVAPKVIPKTTDAKPKAQQEFAQIDAVDTPRIIEPSQPAIDVLPQSSEASQPLNNVVTTVEAKPSQTIVRNASSVVPSISAQEKSSPKLIAIAAMITALLILVLIIVQRERQARSDLEKYFINTFYEAKRGEMCHVYLRRHNGEFTESEFFVQWNAMLKVLIVRFAMHYQGSDQNVLKVANLIQKHAEVGNPKVESLTRQYNNQLLDRTVSDVKAIDSFHHARKSTVKSPSGLGASAGLVT